ncbi:alpha/beta hydrolase [Balneolales bacterium ANBcel1]|nr:alpha/beta hydrolase [Balneolales bacterium ANBcel1]
MSGNKAIMEAAAHQKHTYEYGPGGQFVSYYKTGTGPPLLILHGWGSRASVMLPLANALSDIRTCYIPDLPGFGDSPPPTTPWNVDNYVDLASSFSSSIAGEPIDVLAHSFGGRIVLKWCCLQEAKELLNKVVVTGGAGMKPRRSLSYYRRRISATVLKAPFLLLPEKLRNRALERLRRSRLWKSLGSSDYSRLEGTMRETFVRTVSEHLESCLPEIHQEIFLLWGKGDDATPWYQAERMEKGLRNGTLVGIDQAGHYAFLDQPVRFTRIVRAYLDPA